MTPDSLSVSHDRNDLFHQNLMWRIVDWNTENKIPFYQRNGIKEKSNSFNHLHQKWLNSFIRNHCIQAATVKFNSEKNPFRKIHDKNEDVNDIYLFFSLSCVLPPCIFPSMPLLLIHRKNEKKLLFSTAKEIYRNFFHEFMYLACI